MLIQRVLKKPIIETNDELLFEKLKGYINNKFEDDDEREELGDEDEDNDGDERSELGDDEDDDFEDEDYEDEIEEEYDED